MEQKIENKICGNCKILKQITDFNFKDKKKGKLQSFCRDCHSLKQKEYYKKITANKVKKQIIKIPDGVLIDEEDRELLENIGKWYISDKGYVRKTIRFVEGTQEKDKNISMHRFIWEKRFGSIPNKEQIDHINGNRLDNRKENLRRVTNQENQWNQTKAKGYRWHKEAKKYQAQIGFNDKVINLGFYDTEEEAAKAYLEAKEIYHKIPERKQNDSNSTDI
jgi:hypothetical protein